MRTVDATYELLRTQSGSYYEVRVQNTSSSVTYSHDKLVSVRIKSALTSGSGLSIGGTCSARCDLVLRESSANWPRTSVFTVDVRLCSEDGQTTSGWLTMGTFYTDEREEDRSGNLSINAFDAMLLTEVLWAYRVTLPTTWPISPRQAASLVQEATGITVEGLNSLPTNAYIGLDTTQTARDLLSNIAAGCGGNWVITPEGNLRLVYYQNVWIPPSIVGLAVVGISVVVNEGSSGEPTAEELGNIYIGLSAKNMTVGRELPFVNSVTLTADDGTVSTAGDHASYEVKARCNFADSTVPASLALSKLVDKSYRPFTLSTAILDPVAELGDLIVADGKTFQIGNIDWNISPFITANVSAPYEEEVDHEYTALTQNEKAQMKILNENAEIRSEITQNANKISLVVEEVAGTNVIKVASIVTAINDSGSNVKIEADKIEMTGTTTFLTPSDVGAYGNTVIDGGRITTGLISADRIDVSNLVAGRINGSYVYIGGLGSEAGYIYSEPSYTYYSVAAVRLESYGGLSLKSDDGDLALNADDRLMLISQYGLVTCQGNLVPSADNYYNLGEAGQRWKTVYAGTGTIDTSDRTQKKDIEEIPEQYQRLFEKLKPVRYKLIDGTSDRYHVGLVAQDIEEALKECGIDTKDFAGFVKAQTENGEFYGLRYAEFIGILIQRVQAQDATIKAMAERIDRLEKDLSSLTARLEVLEERM